jgi:hypothetical protein
VSTYAESKQLVQVRMWGGAYPGGRFLADLDDAQVGEDT